MRRNESAKGEKTRERMKTGRQAAKLNGQNLSPSPKISTSRQQMDNLNATRSFRSDECIQVLIKVRIVSFWKGCEGGLFGHHGRH